MKHLKSSQLLKEVALVLLVVFMIGAMIVLGLIEEGLLPVGH